jgi:transposase
MRFVGVDIGGKAHGVAMVDEAGGTLLKPMVITEDAAGYTRLREVLADGGADPLVVLEATGHYWPTLFAVLTAAGFAGAVVNPLRPQRFAEEDRRRSKTDAIDALGRAPFGRQKRPEPTRLPDRATEELRELVHLRDRLVQDIGDRVRQLHRLVDLGFPEFTRHVAELDSPLATAILCQYPTAAAFQGVAVEQLAGLRSGTHHRVGEEVAQALLAAAAGSVGQHHGEPYRRQIGYACEDLDLWRGRLRSVDDDIKRLLGAHDVGQLLTTIPGIGPQTAARLVARVGDPATFQSAGALAAFVGVVPGLRQSGQRQGQRAGLHPLGHARLRAQLWMPTLNAIRFNPWLRAYYQRLLARGKVRKVAIVAAMRKLLIAVYAVAKSRRPFVPHVISQETPA